MQINDYVDIAHYHKQLFVVELKWKWLMFWLNTLIGLDQWGWLSWLQAYIWLLIIQCCILLWEHLDGVWTQDWRSTVYVYTQFTYCMLIGLFYHLRKLIEMVHERPWEDLICEIKPPTVCIVWLQSLCFICIVYLNCILSFGHNVTFQMAI